MSAFDLLIIYVYLFTLFTSSVRLKVHVALYRTLKVVLTAMMVMATVLFVQQFPTDTQAIIIHVIKFVPVIFLIFIVNQNDIKWMLKTLRLGKFMGNLYEQSQNDLIEGIQYLVDHKIGAIITIERDDDLSEYIDKASALNAPINASLMASIFITQSPLHDGAIIIVDQMMVCAGAYFPTSESQAIPKRLGSRHRAALGISEVTDAFTIIVSEETGEVSIALDGKLDLDISKESLLLYLNQYFRQ